MLDCPNRIYDWKPAQKAQTSRDPKAPSVRDSTSADVFAWVSGCLKWIGSNGDKRVRGYALSLLNDTDYTTDMETVKLLGETMLERLALESPWKR